MNRYTQLQYGTLNDLPLPQIPFEALGNVMTNYQNQIDTFDAAKEAQFNVLSNESDQELAKVVNEYQDSIASQLTNIRMNKGTQEYMNALRGGLSSLLKLRKPGGAISALESRYNQVQEGLKSIKERHKDDESMVNYNVAVGTLYESIGNINYDFGTGSFSSINVPTLQNYVDVNKKIRETVGDIIPKETQILKIENGYIYDVYNKQYPITDAVKALIESPEIKAQTLINAKYNYMNMSDEDKATYVDNVNKRNEAVLDNAVTMVEDISTKLMSGNKTQIQEAQAILKTKGFDPGAIDGVAGKRTKEAFDAFTKEAEEAMKPYKEQLTQENIVGEITRGIEENYMRYAGGLVNNSYMEKYKGADWKARDLLRFQRASELVNAVIKPEDPKLVIGAIANTVANYDVDSAQMEADLKTMEVEISENLQPVFENGTFNRASDGSTVNNVTEMYDFYIRNRTSATFKEDYMNKFKITEEQFNKQSQFFSSNNSVLVTLQSRARLVEQIADDRKLIGNITSDFLENEFSEKQYEAIMYSIGSNAAFNNSQDTSFIRRNGLQEQDLIGIKQELMKMRNMPLEEKKRAMQNLAASSDVALKYIQDKIGKPMANYAAERLKNKENVNYYVESETLDESIIGETFTNLVKYSGEGTLIDPITGSETTWVDKDLKPTTKKVLTSSIQAKAAIINGKPAIYAIANDEDGNTVTKAIELSKMDQTNIAAFTTSIDILAKDLLSTNQPLVAKKLLPFLNPLSSTTALVLNNTKAIHSNQTGSFTFVDPVTKNAIPISGKYKELESFRMDNGSGQTVEYAAIAITGPSRDSDKYYIINKNSGEIMTDNIMGFTSPIQAVQELRWNQYTLSIPEGYVPKRAVSKESVTATQSSAIKAGMSVIFDSDPFGYDYEE